MTLSRKEAIFLAIEQKLKNIKAGNKPSVNSAYSFENNVSYVDRQYLVFTQELVESHPMPWIILNNDGELFEPLPSRVFENKVLVSIIGFIKVNNDNENLDSLMNSLQRDILLAMLDDVTLSGMAAFLYPEGVQTAENIIFPFGGFAFTFSITYTAQGLNF